MRLLRLLLISLVVSFSSVAQADQSIKEKAAAAGLNPDEVYDPENLLYIDVIYGRVIIEMLPDVAPNHVKRIKKLTREGFYDKLYFHRVIERFMAQTGDPLGNGTGDSPYPDMKQEFSDIDHVTGTVSMARADTPDSANSQFFIVMDDSEFLNGKYTVWGKVVSGINYVKKLEAGTQENNGSVEYPDRMLRVRIAADVIAAEKASKEAEVAEAIKADAIEEESTPPASDSEEDAHEVEQISEPVEGEQVLD